MTSDLRTSFNSENLTAEDAKRVLEASRGEQSLWMQGAIEISEKEVVDALGPNYQARLESSGLIFEIHDEPVSHGRDEKWSFKKMVSIDTKGLGRIQYPLELEQAQAILNESYQSSEMPKGAFAIDQLDAKAILGEHYNQILYFASSSYDYDMGGASFLLDLDSFQRIAEVDPVSTEALNTFHRFKPPSSKL